MQKEKDIDGLLSVAESAPVMFKLGFRGTSPEPYGTLTALADWLLIIWVIV